MRLIGRIWAGTQQWPGVATEFANARDVYYPDLGSHGTDKSCFA